MNIATFPPPTLAAQLAELKRELGKRASVYPMLVAKGRLTQRQADYQTNALNGAIATLSRLVAAELRGEPGRKELVDLLRDVRRQARGEDVPNLQHRLDAVLERIPE